MKKLFLGVVIAATVLTGLLLLWPTNHKTFASNPATISFQGKVVNADGTNVTNGTYSFIFRIYNTASPTTTTTCTSTATCLWEETQSTVTVTNGIFQVELGSVCALTSASCNNTTGGPINFGSSSSLYLTMKFNGDAAGFMSPTIHITSVPFALNSDQLGGISASGFIQNNSGSAQPSSNFHISGTGQADTQIDAPTFDVITSNTAMGIGTTNAAAITLGNTTNSSFLFKTKASATAYQLQNAAGANMLLVNTSGNGSAPTTPGVVAGSNSTGSLSGASVANYYYKVSAILTGGVESPASSEVSINGASFTTVSAPTAPSAADAGAGLVPCSGSGCRWAVTYRTANGETTIGASSAAQTTTSHQWTITIPVGPTGTVWRVIYRNNNGGAFGQLAVISDNTTTSYLDDNAGVGTTPPVSNTARTNLNSTSVSWTSVAGALSYRIYRGISPGLENTYATSVSSPFTDTGTSPNGGAPSSNATANNVVFNTAQTIFNPSADSTAAFQIQNSSGSPILTADTTNQRIAIDSAYSAMSPPTAAAAVPTQASTPTVTPTGGSSSTTYNYVIVANTAAGPSAVSTAGTTSSGVATLSGTTYNALSWSAYAGATSYSVYRTTGGGSTGLIYTTSSSTVTLTTLNDTGYLGNGISPPSLGSLTGSSTYKYEVTAVDASGGETAASTEVSATTGSSIKSIDVSWNSVYGAISYRIYRTAAGGSTGTEVYLNRTSNLYYADDGSVATTTKAPPGSGSAYYASANTSSKNLELTVGGEGTPTGQVYISGSSPTLAGQSTDTNGGPAFGLAMEGRYAYVLNDTTNKLVVYDVSNPTNPTYIGQNSDSNISNPIAIAVQGRYAYVTGGTNKLQIYDISNPASPTFVSQNTDSTLSGPGFIYVQGRYAYIGNQSGAAHYVDICDVSNPRVFSCSVFISNSNMGTPQQIIISGEYAYITAYNSPYKVWIYKIADPSNPVLVGGISGGESIPTTMVIQGRYAYIGDESFISGVGSVLDVYDISNPANPVLVGQTAPSQIGILNLIVQGRYIYALSIDFSPVQTGVQHLQVYDISNPSNPTLIGQNQDTNNPGQALAIQGRYAYTVDVNNKFDVYDLGGAYTQQLEAGGIETGNLAVDSNAMVAGDESIQGGLSVGQSLNVAGDVGISGQLNVQGLAPTYVGQNSDSSLNSPVGIYVQGRYAYTVSLTTTGSLVVYDISNPNAPTFVGQNSDSNLDNPQGGIYVQGRYAYIASEANNKLMVYDISNPAAPTYVSQNSDSNLNQPEFLYVQGRYAYITSAGSNKLAVYDISNPAAPTFVAVNSDSNLSSPVGLYVQGRYAYVTNDAISGKLVVYDISNPAAPTFVAENSDSNMNSPFSVYVQGRYAYLANSGDNNLAVYDISNPAAPTFVAENSDSNLSSPHSIIVQGRYAYITSEGSNELTVYDISNPAAPTFVGENSDSNLSGPTVVYVQGTYAYVTSTFNNKLVTYNLGGAYEQQVQTGGLETGILQVDTNGQVAGDFNIQGGLSVGQSLNVNGNIGVSGQVEFQNSSNSTTAFEVSNASGLPLFGINTTAANTNNLVANPSFETAISNWSAVGTGSASQTSAQAYEGNDSLLIASGSTEGGAKYTTGATTFLSTSTAYTLSAYIKTDSTVPIHIDMGDSETGTLIPCLSTQLLPENGGWQRFTCSWTTSGSTPTSSFIYFKQTSTDPAATKNIYVDDILLQTNANSQTVYRNGNISFSGAAISSQLVLQNTVNSTNALQVNNASGTQIFDVDTTDSNLISNPGFEVNTTGWSALASTTINRDTSQSYTGIAALKVAMAGATTGGTQFSLNPVVTAASTSYTVSFSANLISGTAPTFQATYSPNGVATSTCSPGAIVTGGWTRVSCTGLTSATTPTTSGFLKIAQTNSAISTWDIDGVQLEVGGTATAYGAGNISLNAVIQSPVVIRGLANSTTSFQVQNANSSTLFNADTLNGTVSIAGPSTSQTTNVLNVSTASTGAAANGFSRFQCTANHTGNCVQLDDSALAGGALTINISGSTQTSEKGLTITQTNTTTTYTGSLISLTGSYTTAASGHDLSITSVHSSGGAALLITANSLTTGSGLNITSSGTITTTGNLVSLTANSASTATGILSISATGLSSTSAAALNISAGTTGNALLIANGNILNLAANTAAQSAVVRFSTTSTVSSSACATATAQGLVFQNTAAAQVGHFCVDTRGTGLTFYDFANSTASTDVAENYSDVNDNLLPGDTVCLDPSGPLTAVVKCSSANDPSAFGIVSTQPGLLMSGIQEDGAEDIPLVNPVPIAISGRVPTSVDTENGDIHPGDYLTTSSTPGVAMKATQGGIIVGQALEGYSGSGIGTIEVFVDKLFNSQPNGASTASNTQTGSSLTLTNLSAQTATVGMDLNVFGQLFANGGLTVQGEADFLGDVSLGGHVKTNGTQPATQLETGAGDTSGDGNLASDMLNGNDTAGDLELTLGDNSSSGKLITVQFNKPFAQAPHILLTPANDQSSSLHYYVTATKDGFTISTTDSGLVAGDQYDFNYWVVQ